MTPAQYLDEIVLPTARAFMASPDDRLKCYLAAITCYHIVDYLKIAGAEKYIRTIRDKMQCDAFDIIDGICQGTKHCETTRSPYKFIPGDDEAVRRFGLGAGQAGFGDGYWDGPGILVRHGKKTYLVHHCIRETLEKFQSHYGVYFEGIDFNLPQ